MNNPGKPLIVALALSAIFTVANIVAVSSGIADSYYSEISDWIINL